MKKNILKIGLFALVLCTGMLIRPTEAKADREDNIEVIGSAIGRGGTLVCEIGMDMSNGDIYVLDCNDD